MKEIKVVSIEYDGNIYDLRVIKEDTQVTQVITKIEPESKEPEKKECQKCNELKPLDNFGRNKSKPDGFQSWCNDCMDRYHRKQKELAKKREYMREYYKKKKKELSFIGITKEVKNEQNIKPEGGIVDGTKPDAIPVTPISNIDEKADDSVISDPEKRKRFHW